MYDNAGDPTKGSRLQCRAPAVRRFLGLPDEWAVGGGSQGQPERLDRHSPPGAVLMSVDVRGVDHQVFSVTAVMRGDGRIDQIGAQHV
jgi:hypothetical protein